MALTTVISFLPIACGCSSSYTPAASPRASIVMDKGTYAYVRDGRKYEGGMFGGDLEEAVQGNEQAEEYAREYKTGMTTGFALTLLGVAAVIGGLVLYGVQAEQTTSGQTAPLTGLFIGLGGVGLELAGDIVIVNAAPHMTDAINAYNDGLLLRPSSPPAAHGPSSKTETSTPPQAGKVEPPSEPHTAARAP